MSEKEQYRVKAGRSLTETASSSIDKDCDGMDLISSTNELTRAILAIQN